MCALRVFAYLDNAAVVLVVLYDWSWQLRDEIVFVRPAVLCSGLLGLGTTFAWVGYHHGHPTSSQGCTAQFKPSMAPPFARHLPALGTKNIISGADKKRLRRRVGKLALVSSMPPAPAEA